MKDDSKAIQYLENILGNCRDKEEKKRCTKAYLSALCVSEHYGPGSNDSIFLMTHPDLTKYLLTQTQDLGMEEDYRRIQKKLQDPTALSFIRALEIQAEIRGDRDRKRQEKVDYPLDGPPDDQ